MTVFATTALEHFHSVLQEAALCASPFVMDGDLVAVICDGFPRSKSVTAIAFTFDSGHFCCLG